jgi:hypothetical protein
MSSEASLSRLNAPDFVIVGPLRAGTTMLRLMLHNHPNIALVGEFEESVAMLVDTGFPSAQAYKDWLRPQRVFQAREYLLTDNNESYQDIVREMWAHLSQTQSDAAAIGCTIHSRIDRILDLWPDVKFICLVRDPRDVCRSCVGMGWAGHPAAATPKWLDPIQHWHTTREHLGQDRWTLVRYEDLLRDPVPELTKCAQLLGLEYNEQMLNFHESSSYQQLDPKLAEQWRHKMKPRCAAIIDSMCLPAMAEFGYEPSTQTPKPPSGLELLRIKLQNAVGKLRWRVDRYGLVLELSWKIARRLPITNPWRTRVRTRMNQINQEHLR